MLAVEWIPESSCPDALKESMTTPLSLISAPFVTVSINTGRLSLFPLSLLCQYPQSPRHPEASIWFENWGYSWVEVTGIPVPAGLPYPTRTRGSGTGRIGVSQVGSGTGKVITGTGYPVLPVQAFSCGVTLSPLHIVVNLTTG